MALKRKSSENKTFGKKASQSYDDLLGKRLLVFLFVHQHITITVLVYLLVKRLSIYHIPLLYIAVVLSREIA